MAVVSGIGKRVMSPYGRRKVYCQCNGVWITSRERNGIEIWSVEMCPKCGYFGWVFKTRSDKKRWDWLAREEKLKEEGVR